MKSIVFSGLTWYVKTGFGRGPGGNNWHEDCVEVDSAGRLHLRIRKIDGVWYCGEIISDFTAEIGDYTFFLASNVERLDKNIVFGLFLYENDTKEVDIEFFNGVAIYCVQPDEFFKFKLNLSGSHSRHSINFHQVVSFTSHHGHGLEYPIRGWVSHKASSAYMRNAKLHLNLWLKNGIPPNEEAEVIIKKVLIEKYL